MIYSSTNFAVDLDTADRTAAGQQATSGTLVVERRPSSWEYVPALVGAGIVTAVMFSTINPSDFYWTPEAMRPFVMPAISGLIWVFALPYLVTRRFEIGPGRLRSRMGLFGLTWSRDLAVSSEGVRVVGRLSQRSQSEPEPTFEPEVHAGNRWMSLGRSASLDTALAFAGRIAEAAGVPMIGLAEP